MTGSRIAIVAILVAALLAPAVALAGGGHGKRDKHAHRAEMKQALETLAASDAEAAATIEEMDALRTWTRGQMKVARTHMKAGEYAEAAARFDTILALELDPDFETRVQSVMEKVKAQRSDDGIFAGKKRSTARADRASRKDRKRLKLYGMSARAHALAGDQALAEQRLDEGISAARAAGAERVVERFEALAADPSKLTESRRSKRDLDPEQLEAEIREAESRLPLAQ